MSSRIKKYINGLSELEYANENFILFFFKHDIDIETMEKNVKKNIISYNYHKKIYFYFSKYKNTLSFLIMYKDTEIIKLTYEIKKTVLNESALYLPSIKYSDGYIDTLEYFCSQMKINYYLLDESDDSISCDDI